MQVTEKQNDAFEFLKATLKEQVPCYPGINLEVLESSILLSGVDCNNNRHELECHYDGKRTVQVYLSGPDSDPIDTDWYELWELSAKTAVLSDGASDRPHSLEYVAGSWLSDLSLTISFAVREVEEAEKEVIQETQISDTSCKFPDDANSRAIERIEQGKKAFENLTKTIVKQSSCYPAVKIDELSDSGIMLSSVDQENNPYDIRLKFDGENMLEIYYSKVGDEDKGEAGPVLWELSGRAARAKEVNCHESLEKLGGECLFLLFMASTWPRRIAKPVSEATSVAS